MGYPRSSNYICTVMTKDRGFNKIVDALKHQAKIRNAQQRLTELMRPEIREDSWSGRYEVRKRYVVRVRGRLGKDNPNAELYRFGGKLHTWTSQDIKLEHSERADIYMMETTVYKYLDKKVTR